MLKRGSFITVTPLPRTLLPLLSHDSSFSIKPNRVKIKTENSKKKPTREAGR
jgi:hypothetical protein